MSLLKRPRRISRSNRSRGFASFDGLTSLLGVAALGVATLSGVFFAPAAVPSDDAAFLSGGVIQFTTSSSDFTFDPADYPGLRAVRVQVQGAGGAGGGRANGGPASGGGGGGYGERLIPASLLTAPVTVTVGAGGNGVSQADGQPGGASSFGSFVTANGGGGGQVNSGYDSTDTGGAGGTVSGADTAITGQEGGWARADSTAGGGIADFPSGGGGDSFWGRGATGRPAGQTGPGNSATSGYGAGGGGAIGNASQTGAGGDGTDGIVIVELLY